ncbi:helix-turn-helix domain-containing protein [Rhizobium pusense]|uniref:helix-turn-helix transcriptional regulator n=1 Tax=Agrobacterium pusense TaxID=648995 RepID=UPI00244D4B46|nr:helix-turn-helix domain-containing protein [Agrobacterium pusense]MDH2091111.1 helix-turn-helix domain-containing protein [Agrobacterium pusense]
MEQENEGADLLYGVPSISAFLGLTDAVVYHLAKREDFPTFKIGGKVCALKSALKEWLKEQASKPKARCG